MWYCLIHIYTYLSFSPYKNPCVIGQRCLSALVRETPCKKYICTSFSLIESRKKQNVFIHSRTLCFFRGEKNNNLLHSVAIVFYATTYSRINILRDSVEIEIRFCRAKFFLFALEFFLFALDFRAEQRGQRNETSRPPPSPLEVLSLNSRPPSSRKRLSRHSRGTLGTRNAAHWTEGAAET